MRLKLFSLPDKAIIAQPNTKNKYVIVRKILIHFRATQNKPRRIMAGFSASSSLSFLFRSKNFVQLTCQSIDFGRLIGVLLGLLAGYYGKWMNTLLMRLCDTLLTFPGILLALLIVAIRDPNTANVIVAITTSTPDLTFPELRWTNTFDSLTLFHPHKKRPADWQGAFVFLN